MEDDYYAQHPSVERKCCSSTDTGAGASAREPGAIAGEGGVGEFIVFGGSAEHRSLL